MNRRQLFVLLIISILLSGLLILYLFVFPYQVRDRLNPNSIIVRSSKNINKNDVSVIWSSRTTDTLVLYENGTDLKRTYKKYGKNYFWVTYQDSIIAEFQQFKYNNWHGHRYIFEIEVVNDSIKVDWEVEDPDSAHVFKN